MLVTHCHTGGVLDQPRPVSSGQLDQAVQERQSAATSPLTRPGTRRLRMVWLNMGRTRRVRPGLSMDARLPDPVLSRADGPGAVTNGKIVEIYSLVGPERLAQLDLTIAQT
jgi:hypothetical protein